MFLFLFFLFFKKQPLLQIAIQTISAKWILGKKDGKTDAVATKVAGMWTATFKVAAEFEWADNLHMGANKVIGCSVSWRDRGREVKNDLATSGYGNQDGELAFCNRRQKKPKKTKNCLISRLRTRGDILHVLADNTCRLKYIILPGVSAQTSHPGKISVHVAQQQFSEMKTEIKRCASFCLPSVFLFYR